MRSHEIDQALTDLREHGNGANLSHLRKDHQRVFTAISLVGRMETIMKIKEM